MKVKSKNGEKSYEYDYKMILVYAKVRQQLKDYCKKNGKTYSQVISQWLKQENK